MHYRMLHTASKKASDPCYMTKSGGIISPDPKRARVWKTWEGAAKFFNTKGVHSGYEIEAFDPEKEPESYRENILRDIRALAESLGIDQAGIDIRDICSAELGE